MVNIGTATLGHPQVIQINMICLQPREKGPSHCRCASSFDCVSTQQVYLCGVWKPDMNICWGPECVCSLEMSASDLESDHPMSVRKCMLLTTQGLSRTTGQQKFQGIVGSDWNHNIQLHSCTNGMTLASQTLSCRVRTSPSSHG